MSSRFAGRRAVVTGGTRGIGAAIAERFVREGAEVIVTGRTKGTDVCVGAKLEVVDLADRTATEAFGEMLSQRSIDVLVNNAGINAVSAFEQIDSHEFDAIQTVNVRAPFVLCRAVLPGMRQRRWGRIVNIASIFGVVTKAWRASYSTSKFALDGMTAALAVEVASDGVLANCVSPGFIETDLTRRILDEQERADLAATVPMGRFGLPQEIASLVTWLASEENTYVTAQNFVIDGGFSRV